MKINFLVAIVLFIGILGCRGPQGIQGPPGVTGAPGGNCTVTTVPHQTSAPSGGSLISCPDGTQSLVLNGTNGTNGTSGTIVAPVQLCRNPRTTYPSTFAEVGFCINGNLYAVYSQNGGFLSDIPNGTYSSNGINASCSFTVTGCTVSNQSN